MNQLAAALWADALRLLSRMEKPGLDVVEGKKIERLIHARMREAISMLEQVLREAPGFRLARLRLAYYLRVVDPAAAVEHFQRLIRSHGPQKQRLKRDLAALLVSLGRYAAAAELVEHSPTDPADCLLSLTVAWRTRNVTWAAELFPCAARAMNPSRRAETWAHLAAVQASPAAWYEQTGKSRLDLHEAVGKALHLLVEMGRMEQASRLAEVAGLDHVVASKKPACGVVLSRLAGYCAFLAGPEKAGSEVEVSWQPNCRVKGSGRSFRRCLCQAGRWCRAKGCAARFLLRFGQGKQPKSH